MENRGVMIIYVMDVPLVWYACAMSKGHVVRLHSTMYSVVVFCFILCLGCLCGQVCMILTIGLWWVRMGVF